MESLNSNKVTTNLLSENRLRCEWSEWKRMKNEYPCVEVVPLESNIHEWHCNIVANDGVYVGLIFHVIIKFPSNYPLTKPTVYAGNLSSHLSVPYDQLVDVPLKKLGKEWTPQRSVVSILKRLKSFLFAKIGGERILSNYFHSHSTTNHNFNRKSLGVLHKNVSKYECRACGHCFEKPFPTPQSIMVIEKECNHLRIDNIKSIIINNNNMNQSTLLHKCNKLLDIFGDNS